jgi:hypothetical protein
MDAVTYNLIKNICRYTIIIVDLVREWAERNERQYSQGTTTREHSPEVREQNVQAAEEALQQRLQEQIQAVTRILDNRSTHEPRQRLQERIQTAARILDGHEPSTAEVASSAASSDDETAVPASTDEGYYRATDTDEEF